MDAGKFYPVVIPLYFFPLATNIFLLRFCCSCTLKVHCAAVLAKNIFAKPEKSKLKQLYVLDLTIMSFFTSRRFFPLFTTQFLGAFNDNILKNALMVLITYSLSEEGGEAAWMVALASGLFILPFFIFSATAGQLADKYDRARLTRILKAAEIVIMLIAALGFYFEHSEFLMVVLFAMGTHSTFFGPIKYALLPQHLHEDELLAGNGYVESGTFLAILLGTILGGLLVLAPLGTFWVSACLLLVASAGYTASRFIPAAPPPEPKLKVNWNIVRETWRMIGFARERRRVFLSILGISWFWFVGATLLSQFSPFTRHVIGGDETVVTLFYAAFSIGIALGSMLCAKLLGGQITTRHVPKAAFFLALFVCDSYLASVPFKRPAEGLYDVWAFLQAGGWRITLDFLFAAAAGGMFVVPLYTVMQHESVPQHRARIIAANNIMNACFMVVSAGATLLAIMAGLTIAQIFLGVGLASFGVAVFITRLVSVKP